MTDIATSFMLENRIDRAKNKRQKAENAYETEEYAKAAELFAAAGDAYSAAAELTSYDGETQLYEDNARKCWRLADEVEKERTEQKKQIQKDDSGTDNDSTDYQDPENQEEIGDGRVGEMIVTNVEVDLDDYVGRENLKDDINRKVLSHNENPELTEKYDIDPANGIILYGPPGTGKSFFTRCMAGELDMPFVEIEIPDITSKYINESAELIKKVFQEVQEHGPMMVCINDIDSLTQSRDNDMNTSEVKALNQLLRDVERLGETETIIVGTTNKLDDMDGAITRSGRFTDKFEVGVPGTDFHREMIQREMASRPLHDSWDLEEAVQDVAGCTPADLAEICNEAARRGKERHKQTNESGITNTMFHNAVEDILE